MKSKREDVRWIKCGKHDSLRRWSIVCIHLLNASSTDWNALPQEDPLDTKPLNDWLCNQCINNVEDIVVHHKLDDVQPICVKCVEDIRRVFDRNYDLGKDIE